MKVALFTHHFLEPTHHAIAQVLRGLEQHSFVVFAKRFELWADHALTNVSSRHVYVKGTPLSLREEGVDLVHAIFDGKVALRAGEVAAELGLPFVLSFHGGFDIHAKIRDPRYTAPTRALAQQATAVTVVCAADVERLRRIGVERHVDVIRVPVDVGALPESAPQAGRLVCVARLVPKKGVDLAIRALIDLPKHQLVVVGDGPERQRLVDQACASGVAGRVRFCGTLGLQSMLTTLASASVLVHPARVADDGNADGTPQAMLWAHALGLPIVAADTGSIAELVTDGRSGILVPAESPAALAAAVRRLDAEPVLRAHLAAGGAAVVKRHLLPAVVEDFVRLYERCMGVPRCVTAEGSRA